MKQQFHLLQAPVLGPSTTSFSFPHNTACKADNRIQATPFSFCLFLSCEQIHCSTSFLSAVYSTVCFSNTHTSKWQVDLFFFFNFNTKQSILLPPSGYTSFPLLPCQQWWALSPTHEILEQWFSALAAHRKFTFENDDTWGDQWNLNPWSSSFLFPFLTLCLVFLYLGPTHLKQPVRRLPASPP